MAEGIRIFDSAFMGLSKSASLGGDNLGFDPTYFRWNLDGRFTRPTFFTDAHISKVAKYGPNKDFVAWILEPHCLRVDPYIDALEYQAFFGTVLTHDERYLHNEKWEFAPFGGSWIRFNQWGIHEKTKNISIIASPKKTTPGHQLRHQIIDDFGIYIDDIYGAEYNPIDSKLWALAPYRYSIVVESCRQNFYFTEKLIDCLAVGAVPIYWGCPDIGNFFNMDGILSFETIDELMVRLGDACPEDHRLREDAIKENMETAKQFRIAEDWIYMAHTELFK